MAEEYTAEEILEIQSEIARLQQEGKPIPDHLYKAYLDIAKGVKGHSDALEQSFKRLGSEILRTTISAERGAKKYGSVLDAGAAAIGQLSKKSKTWGKLLSGSTNALFGLGKASLGAADTLFKNYQDLSTVGATGATGMTGLLENLHQFSFSLSEMESYSTMVKTNSDILARIGATTNKGLKQLGAVSDELLKGGTDTEFYEMGFSTEAVNDGLMAYNRYQAMLGNSVKLNHAERTKGTREWIKTQRNLTKITGLNTKALEQIAFAAQNEARFGSYLTELQKRDPEAVNKLNAINQKFTGLYGEDLARGFRDLSQGIVGNSEEAAKFQRSFPEAAELVLNGVKDEKKITDAIQRDAKRTSGLVRGLNLNQSESANLYLDIATYNRIIADKSFDDRQRALAVEGKINDKSTKSAAEIAAANRKLELTTDNVVAMGIAPTLKAFQLLNEILIKLIPGAKPTEAAPPPSEKAIKGAQVPADMQKYLQATALVESGGVASAKASTSSAGGLFQFIDSTWKETVKEMGKNYTLQDKYDPQKSAEVMAYFTQKQQKRLEQGIGRKASSGDLYLAHFLGVGGAIKFLKAMMENPNLSAASLDSKAASANRSIYFDKNNSPRSLEDVYNLMTSKIARAEAALDKGRWGGKPIPEAVQALGGEAAKPSAAKGGILSGPISGYEATLHGTEAVVPLGNGDSIKISSVNHVELIAANNNKIGQQLGRLTDLSRAIKDQISVSNKILQYTN
jgi:hypothetical protein